MHFYIHVTRSISVLRHDLASSDHYRPLRSKEQPNYYRLHDLMTYTMVFLRFLFLTQHINLIYNFRRITNTRIQQRLLSASNTDLAMLFTRPRPTMSLTAICLKASHSVLHTRKSPWTDANPVFKSRCSSVKSKSRS